MNKFYQTSGIFKNIYITDSQVWMSDDDYKTLEAFLEKMNVEKVSKLDTHLKLSYSQFQKLVLFPEENGIQVFYNEAGKQDRTYLQFDQVEEYNEVLNYIVSKCNLQAQKETQGSLLSLARPSLYSLAAVAFSFALVMSAQEMEAGGTVVAGGSRKGFKTLLINVAEILGFWGSVAVLVAVLAGCTFYLIKAYKNTKTERDIYC